MTPRLISTLFITLIAMPAFADEMPTRKAGLWEIQTSAGNGMSIRQCIDAATDQTLQAQIGSGPGAAAQRQCSKRDVQKSGNTITVDSTCTTPRGTVTSHVVVTGSFDSAYTMTATSQGTGLPNGGNTTTATVKWLGACAADQKPGDMIMPNGMKINILDMQKRGAPGMMMPPPPSH